jgi:hypothetical protein
MMKIDGVHFSVVVGFQAEDDEIKSELFMVCAQVVKRFLEGELRRDVRVLQAELNICVKAPPSIRPAPGREGNN